MNRWSSLVAGKSSVLPGEAKHPNYAPVRHSLNLLVGLKMNYNQNERMIKDIFDT